jgi:FkbM family methyltransferase
VEANPILFSSLTENSLIKKFNYAVCGQNGPICFHLSNEPEASSIMRAISDYWGTKEDIQVMGIRFEDLLEKHYIKNIDLLKVDIEGGEIDMFRSMSDETILGIKQITVEFHSFCNPALEKDVSDTKSRLQNLGFLCLPFPSDRLLALDSDILFINKKAINLTCGERIRNYVPFLALRAALQLPGMRPKLGKIKIRLKSFLMR